MSHAILRSILPNGHLHTFDFHQDRVFKAKEEFREHGIEANVTVKKRDVCSTGFDLDSCADAVFLDLPSPWEALPYAKTALKSAGLILSFALSTHIITDASVKSHQRNTAHLEQCCQNF